jgi:hypothetical protein
MRWHIKGVYSVRFRVDAEDMNDDGALTRICKGHVDLTRDIEVNLILDGPTVMNEGEDVEWLMPHIEHVSGMRIQRMLPFSVVIEALDAPKPH